MAVDLGVWRRLALPGWVLSMTALVVSRGRALAWAGVAISSLPVLALLEERCLEVPRVRRGRPMLGLWVFVAVWVVSLVLVLTSPSVLAWVAFGLCSMGLALEIRDRRRCAGGRV